MYVTFITKSLSHVLQSYLKYQIDVLIGNTDIKSKRCLPLLTGVICVHQCL